MSWTVTRINTYWSAEQAGEVISLLDELRDQLWASHGEKIITMRLEELEYRERNDMQGTLDFEDDLIDF